MPQRVLAQLPAAPLIVALVADADVLAIVCDGGACFAIQLSAPLPVTPRPVCEFAGPVAGAGGWRDQVYFVEQSGRVIVIDLGSGAMTTRDIGPCRRWLSAPRAPISARIVPMGGALNPTYRSDLVEVWDEARGVLLVKIEPETRDCFEIDHVALTPDGQIVAFTGFDVYYTTDGDWGWGQQEVLVAAEVPSGRRLLDLVLGETMRPSEHEPIPVVLDDRACFAGGVFLELPDRSRGEPPTPVERAGLDEEPPFEDVTHLAALGDGRAAIVCADVTWSSERGQLRPRRVASRRVRIIDAHGDELTHVELPVAVTTLTAVGSALVIGGEDGRLVLLDPVVQPGS